MGHPLHITGEAGEMADEAARFAARLRKELGIEVELADERLTSWEAEQTMAEFGSARRRKNASVDDVAAAILLREYLDTETRQQQREGITGMRRLGLLALLLIAAIGAGAGWIDSQISRPYRGRRPEKVFVEIPHGTSRWNIAGILRHDDVIRNRVAFALFSLWHLRTPLQAGEYYVDRPVTTREVFWQIAQGKIFIHTVTIPEG